jgi:hypothetical protein
MNEPILDTIRVEQDFLLPSLAESQSRMFIL